MDLLQLKLIPLATLPVVNAVTSLLAAPSAIPKFQSQAIKLIGDNISRHYDEFVSDFRASNPLLLAFPQDNVRSLASEIFASPWTSSDNRNLTELYHVSIPLSEAFTRLNFESKNIADDYSLKTSLFTNTLENSFSTFSGSSIQGNILNSPLPLSFIRDFTSNARNSKETNRSTPNRQPYETGRELKRATSGLGTLFQKFLRRTTQR